MTEEDSEKLQLIQIQKTKLKMELKALDMSEMEILKRTTKILPGDKVRRTCGKMPGVVFVVNQVHPIASMGSGGKPWVSGYQIRKDGTRGMTLTHLYYEWEKVEDGISPECGET